MENSNNRRPISSRSTSWAKRISQYLVRKNISPNDISVASIIFALFGSISILFLQNYWGFILCFLFIQLRLLCNLFDGMVAIEGGKKSILGNLYNEFPDRIADSFLIVALGYAVNLPELGWLGALLAALTAYVRIFGGSLGLEQNFIGPMAKQHRMAVYSAACILGQFEYSFFQSHYILILALIVIIVGSLLTCVNRTLEMSKKLQEDKQ